MKKIVFSFLAIALCVSNLFAQTSEEFKPSGKPFVTVFTNYHHDFVDGENQPAFELQRAYFGYAFKYTENISGKVTFDVGNPENDSKLKNTAYVKVATLDYKKDKLSASFGLIGLNQFSIMEKTRGHRYISKSFQDKNKFGNSADLGVKAQYDIHKMFGIDIALTNGEGYKSLQSDGSLKVAGGMTLKPVDNLTVRGYYDYYNNEDIEGSEAQSTVSAFIGYMTDNFACGAEYAMQNNQKLKKDHNYNGFSFSAAYQFTEKLEVFGRFDYLTSEELENEMGEKEAWNIKKDGQFILFGLEYMPNKNIRIAPNFQGFQSAVKDSKYITVTSLNFEFKF